MEAGDGFFPYQDRRIEDVYLKPAGLLAQEGPGLMSSLPWGCVGGTSFVETGLSF